MIEDDPGTRFTPEEGDVVIRHATTDGRRVYILETARGAGQILHGTREAAVAQAVAFARQNHVCVWVGDGDTHTLLQDFRHAEPV